MATKMMHVRLDENLKQQATEALAKVGLSPSQAVRLFFNRVVAEQGYPLALKVPNEETRAAMAESDELIRQRRARFDNAEEMFAALDRGE